MEAQKSKNKRIAKNTLFLYARMFLTMVIGLYTSRIVLRVLGESDYGVYSVVGSLVIMLAYINSVFVSATQRYMSYSLGDGTEEKQHKVFCTSMSVHIILALIIFVLAETVGLWFINTCLEVPEERMCAANWVYQFSIISVLTSILTIPYNSSVIAHERMNIFAYISIIDAVMKLLMAYMLLTISWDKLIVYAALMSVITLITSPCYVIYCRNHFKECHYQVIIDKCQIKEMAAFSGWTAVGTLGFTFKDQLINILINIFYGTAVNAARGLTMQVNNIVNQFVVNIFMAVSPQIIKQYAAGNITESRKLVYGSAKFAFFLMGIIIIPLIINLRYILTLWLGEVPRYTYEFLVIILIGSLLATLSTSCTTALQATGNIRNFQITISILFLCEIPAAYILMHFDCAPFIAILPSLITQFLGILVRFYILHKQVEGYGVAYFLSRIVLQSVCVIALAFTICTFIACHLHQDSFPMLCVSTLIYIVITISIIYFAGISKNEREYINVFLKKNIRKT